MESYQYKFKKDDIVRLRTGGPEMFVQDIWGKDGRVWVECYWYDIASPVKQLTNSFPEAALEKVDNKTPPPTDAPLGIYIG